MTNKSNPRNLRQLLKILQATKSEATPIAVELGNRGYEASQIKEHDEDTRCKKCYLNLAKPCFELVVFLWNNNLLHVLAAHADLEEALPGSTFPFEIPAMPKPELEGQDWNLEWVAGTDESKARARLLLWLAVAFDAPKFGRDWLYYRRLLAILGCVHERDGEIHPIRRVERGCMTQLK